MKRAIAVFIENKRNLILQLKCLYTSLEYINSNDTDLVVFAPKDVLEQVPNDCIKIPCNPISYNQLWENYHYINSIYCLTPKYSRYLDEYDLILRTDVDTFLTPAWNNYYPTLYSTGRGGYVNDEETRIKLHNISNKLGLKHKGIHNIGSTHYGNAKLVADVCSLSMEVAQYIFETEFKDGIGNWPGWYKPVTTLYASEIAVNHLVDEFLIDDNKLDFGSASNDNLDSHPHIHCWHTNNLFSKFMFCNDKYNDFDIQKLDTNIVKNYCLYMALMSKK